MKEELESDCPGIRTLCPTRWTVRAKSLSSIIANYDVLQIAFEKCMECAPNSDIKCRLIGVLSQMQTFNFYFGLLLGELILSHCDNLSIALQSKKLSASKGQEIAALTVKTLMFIRSEVQFDMFWKKVIRKCEDIDVEEPKLPRKRRAPSRLEVESSSYFPNNPKDLYRRYYFEALDFAIQAIQNRFDQPGFKIYKTLQNLLVNAAKGKDISSELKVVCDHYKDDLCQSQLKLQLLTLAVHFSEHPHIKQEDVDFDDVYVYIKSLNDARIIYSQVVIVLKIILVMPATNASSERSFSALRIIKNYLRSTMKQERLNHLMILHVYKDEVDNLNLVDIANQFVSIKPEHRSTIFGTFSSTDFLPLAS